MAERIAVVFGGVSNENEISVITGTMAANVLADGGKEVLPVYISQEGKFFAGAGLAKIAVFGKGEIKRYPNAVFGDGGVYLGAAGKRTKKFVKVDCVLNCCHGGWGESGGISGLCAAANLPLAGAGVFESSAFMDKYLTKIVLKGLGVETVPFFYADFTSVSAERDYKDGAQDYKSGGRTYEKEAEALGYPLIVKPANLGSSIGVSKVSSMEELQEALNVAFIYDSAAVVESYIGNRREINCAAYRGPGGVKVSECEEAQTDGDVLSFEDKYCGGGRSKIPADIPEEISDYIKNTTRRVYESLNMRGIVRFDYIYSDKVYLSEINTVPGSLGYYLFAGSFKKFYPVLDDLISEAELFFKNSHKKLISTGILKSLPSNACKTGKK